MTRILWTALAALLIVSGPGYADTAAATTDAAPKQLQQLYADYNAALAAKDGDKAAGYLHSNIVKIYGEALQLARSAPREQLEAAPTHKKLIALYTRWAAPADVAASDDPRKLIAFMVRQGVLRTDTDVSRDLRDFVIAGDHATAHVYSKGQRTALKLEFGREAGEWKIDLTPLNSLADGVYAKAAEMQKITVDEALFKLIEANTKRPVTDEIWRPLNASEADG